VRTEFDTFKTQVEGERKFSGIKSKAREHFLGLNPVLSEDPAKAERQVNTFLNGLQRYEYPEQEGITLITQNGHRIEDEHGNPIPFDKFIHREAEQLFDFRTQGDKGQAGNKYVPGTTVAAPQNEEDYRKQVDSETDPKKLVAIQDAWIKSQGKKPPVL
jgi:hypothetical protein